MIRDERISQARRRIVAPWLIFSAMGVVLARGFDGAVWNPPFA